MNNSKLNKFRSWPKKVLTSILPEMPYLLVVLSGLVIELAHIGKTSWKGIILYDGDSLTLPLLRESLAHKEHLLWVFSAQLNLFPEGILYALSSIFSKSIRASIVVYALITMLSFYFIVRLIIKTISKSSKRRQRVFSVLLTLILLGYMLLETQRGIVNQDAATYFLFSSYYSGLLLIGLLEVYIILKQLNLADQLKYTKNIFLATSTIALTTLVIASDPLYVVQFVLPIIVTCLLLFALKKLSTKKLLIITASQILGLAAGLCSRSFIRPLLGENLSTHLSGGLTVRAVQDGAFSILSTVSPYQSTWGVRARVYISIIVYFSLLLYALVSINNKFKGKKYVKSPLKLFVLFFAVLEPIITYLSLLIANSIQERYFINTLIVPIIGLAIFADVKVPIKFKAIVKYSFIAFFILIIICGLLSLRSSSTLVSSNYPDETCLEASLDHKPVYGVGDYYISRALDAYNLDNERVLQVKPNFSIFPWLNNLGAYENKNFSFVVVEKDWNEIETNNNIQNLTISNLPGYSFETLGSKTKVKDCPDFYLYEYSPGSEAYINLNNDVKKSLSYDIKLRSEGKLSSINN
jgi:hypothetical protein